MSEEITKSDEDYYQEIRSRKSSLNQGKNTLIWILAFFLSFLTFIIGFLDWQADYGVLRTSSSYTETYVSSNGETSVRTLQPIFGRVFTRNANGGFLPDFVQLSIHNWIVLSIILLCGIPAFMIYRREGKRLEAIDENLPYLLREVADSQRIGMQLPRAIAEAAKRNYGPLTPELKKLAAKVSWGIPFRDAMMSFRQSLNTPLAKQATILILEAERSGGELEKIFDSAKDYVEELLGIKKERESQIRPYIYIVFISYIIFAVVIYVLFTTFFAPFGAQAIVTRSGQEIIPVPIYAFEGIFLYLLITQAFFSGLVAGKMGHGSIKQGLTYSTVLMTFGLILHRFLIIPAVQRILQQAAGS